MATRTPNNNRKLACIFLPIICAALFGWQLWKVVNRERLRQPLFAAIHSGDAPEVKRLLERGANPNERDLPTKPSDWKSILISLFKPDRSHPSEFYISALMAACNRQDNANCVKLLLDAGADVNALEDGKMTPLLYAAAIDDVAVIRLLLDRGAKVDVKNSAGETPLMLACVGKDPSVVKLLIEHGANVRAEDHENSTALKHAVRAGSWMHIQPLILAGGDPNTIAIGPKRNQYDDNIEAHCLIDFAIKRYDFDLLMFLVNHGAEPNRRDSETHSALSLAFDQVTQNSDRDDEDEENKSRQSNLKVAKSMLEFLLQQGADANVHVKDEEATLLQRAVRLRRTDLAELLIRARTNLGGTYKGETILQTAVLQRDALMVKMLLMHIKDVDPRDTFGVTPLMIATWNDDVDIRDMLKKAGANPKLKDNMGRTADWYQEHHHEMLR